MSRRTKRQRHVVGAGRADVEVGRYEHETHAVVRARQQMHTVADAYVELGRRLGGDGSGGGSEIRTAPGARLPLSAPLAAARMEIEAWSTFLARAVMDARDEAGQPWAPRDVAADALLREIADEHLGVFTADPLEAAEHFDACAEHAASATRIAWPSGARWIRLGVPCPESGTDDMGRRVPCGGEYRMLMRPDQDVLGDMVCDRDGAHRITPAEWQRAMRRRSVGDPAAAARLVRTIRLAGRSIA